MGVGVGMIQTIVLFAWLLGSGHGIGVPKNSALSTSRVAAEVDAVRYPTPQFRRYGMSDGLPSSTVYAVMQDHQGFMWFAVGVDLVRYDGIAFKIFRHSDGESASLSEGTIYSLLADEDNHIWVGGFGSGLNRYRPATGDFMHWRHDSRDPRSLASDNVWSIAQTKDGSLWVATDVGLDRMLPDGKHFEHVRNPLNKDGKGGFGVVRALMAEPNGRLWIGSNLGLFVRDSNGLVRKIPIDDRVKSLKIWRIQGRGGDVRIAIRGGLLRIGADGEARLYADADGQIPSTDVYSSTLDKLGHLWVATRNGLYLADGSGRIRHISGQPLLTGSLSAPQVWDSLRDREGGLWFVMSNGGVAYLAPGWNEFTRFTHIPDDPDSLRDSMATAVVASTDAKLWVGGRGIVDELDPETGAVRHVVTGLKGSVLDMLEDARQRLWIVSEGGVYRFADDKLSPIDLISAHAMHPRRVALGADGNIYLVSLHDGLFKIDPDSLKVDPTPVAPAGDSGFLGNRLARQNTLDWYTYHDKVMHWDACDHRLEPVSGLSHRGEIYALDFTSDGFWAARDKVLEHYHLDRHRRHEVTLDRSIDTPRSWPPMVLIAMHFDSLGRVWLFCKNGLWRFDPHTGKLRSFGLRNGLVNSELRGDSPTMTPDGTIYSASLGGVIGFHPHPPSVSIRPPAVLITSISVRRQGVRQTLPILDHAIALRWDDRELRIEARSNSYVDPAATHYRFRLEGFDSSWVDVGTGGERAFTGLGAGDYELKILAVGADGSSSGLIAPVAIHVQAPPWMRWWAWLGYVLVFLALVGLVVRESRRRLAQGHRMQLIDQQRQMAEAASAAKTRFLATLSHEIRTPMTGVMGMAELLLSTRLSPLQLEYARAMQRSGSMLLKLLNDALDLARIEAGRLELEPVPFDPRQLVEEVVQLEQGLAYAKGIRLVLDVADNLPPQLIGDAVRIKQVLLNLANNALKFTEGGRVTLQARRASKGLVLSVIDSGPGIPEASQARLFHRFEQDETPQRRSGSGLGLAICRELVDIMGGSIELESRMGHGSTFRVRLPLKVPAEPVAPPARPASTGHYRLLLVEDDAIVAAVISGLLERQGHAVAHVVNGLAALAELANNTFDAVLLDLDLPGVDGFQIARLIRQRENDERRVPIIAVTARSDKGDEALARAAGMDGFLRKPVSGEELAQALSQIPAVAGKGTETAS